MTIITVVVGIWSLYYAGVQAEVARKTLEMAHNEAHAELQTEIAEVQKCLAAGVPDKDLAAVLGRLAVVQGQLAAQQKRSTAQPAALAEVQAKLGEVQQAVAQLKEEQLRKDGEIAALRTRLTEATKPTTTTLAQPAALLKPRLLTRLPEQPFSYGKLGTTGLVPLPLVTAPATPDTSWLGWALATWRDWLALACKYPVPAGYFAVVAFLALGRLFGSK